MKTFPMPKAYKAYLKTKRAALVLDGRGFMVIHVGRDWTMDQITEYANKECRAAHNRDAISIEVSEFGEIGTPKQKFVRDETKRWVKVHAKRWPRRAVLGWHRGIHDAVEKAARELASDGGAGDETTPA